jgi:hypothetical protein
MARSLALPEEVKAKLENPRAKVFTTLERIFDSSVGREYLKVEPDPEHGLRGVTTKDQFLRGFKKLVTDITLGRQSSRTLNKNEDIRAYFESWDPKELPEKKQGSFVPADIIKGHSIASPTTKPKKRDASKTAPSISSTVLPRDFKVRYGADRLRDIRNELVKIKRESYPNAGAVLLRVFFELAVLDYLERIKELPKIIKRIESKTNSKLPFGMPKLKDVVPDIIKIAKEKLKPAEALKVEKAITYNPSAPFTISELHGFVHYPDFPSARDILQFWDRTEPLFRLMLEQEQKVSQE